MIWWRGQGLWMGLLVALCIVGGGKLGGPAGVALGCFAGAMLSFLLRGSADDDASQYSIPVRYWPYPLLLLSVFCFFSR